MKKIDEIAHQRIKELEHEVSSLQSKFECLKLHTEARLARDRAVIVGQLSISMIDRSYPVDF